MLHIKEEPKDEALLDFDDGCRMPGTVIVKEEWKELQQPVNFVKQETQIFRPQENEEAPNIYFLKSKYDVKEENQSQSEVHLENFARQSVTELVNSDVIYFNEARSHLNLVRVMRTQYWCTCIICGKSIAGKHNLKTHMFTHTGERPFSCNECKKSFSQKQILKCHMRTHTGEQPFSCDVCGKSFSFKQNLVTHIRMHTGERPFRCEICGKTYTQKVILNAHMNVHKVFSCEICGKSYKKEMILNLHRRMHDNTVRQSIPWFIVSGVSGFRVR